MKGKCYRIPPDISFRVYESFVDELPACLSGGVRAAKVELLVAFSLPECIIITEIRKLLVSGSQRYEIAVGQDRE